MIFMLFLSCNGNIDILLEKIIIQRLAKRSKIHSDSVGLLTIWPGLKQSWKNTSTLTYCYFRCIFDNARFCTVSMQLSMNFSRVARKRLQNQTWKSTTLMPLKMAFTSIDILKKLPSLRGILSMREKLNVQMLLTQVNPFLLGATSAG